MGTTEQRLAECERRIAQLEVEKSERDRRIERLEAKFRELAGAPR